MEGQTNNDYEENVQGMARYFEMGKEVSVCSHYMMKCSINNSLLTFESEEAEMVNDVNSVATRSHVHFKISQIFGRMFN